MLEFCFGTEYNRLFLSWEGSKMPFDGQKLSQVTQDLILARDWIEEYGLCKKYYSDGDKRCIIGSLIGVTTNLSSEDISFISLESYPEETGERIESAVKIIENLIFPEPIVYYNDTHTKEEVIALFDKAIAKSME